MMKLRSQYGSSAIILQTREIREGGLLGSPLLSRRMVEISFMLEEGGARSSSATERRGGVLSPLPERERPRSSRPERKLTPHETLDRISRLLPPEQKRAVQPLIAEAFEKQEKRAKTERVETPAATVPIDLPSPEKPRMEPVESKEKSGEITVPPPSGDLFTVSEEEFRALMGKMELPVEETSAPASTDSVNTNLSKIRKRLIRSQMSDEFTERVMSGLEQNLSAVEKREFRSVEEKSVELLAKMIRTLPDVAPSRGECRAVMLIGPTGSGKTTSIAKLAAKYYIMEKREVSLYSLDHYRLAATEQLKIYASVMGLPFYAPVTPEEFREQMRRDGAEIMFVDTSGISHTDQKRLKELKRFIDACEVRLEKHLVVATNTNPAIIEKILRSYESVGFDKILLTKLDETDFIGSFIEFADKMNRPFSYITNGQEVPGDILEPDPVQLARIVLRDGLKQDSVQG